MKLDTHELTNLGASLAAAGAAAAEKTPVVVRKSAFDIQHDAQDLVHVDTGFLKSTISTDITGSVDIVAEIGPTAEYGIWQEIGTSVMPPAPYMGPAFDRRLPQFEAAMGALGLEVLK